MVPALTNGGPSFKGAALYYLHDKRQAGEIERLTSERVAWTHVINLPTDDPERAWRMMATTAMKADELKAAAGIKATGRKGTKPAFAYSLSWHPDEKPTQAEQLAAAQETLKRLQLTEHQAIIVCHRDEPHAHVHVIVNRVHPAEGRMATLSKSKLALSQWAEEYEQGRGKILCPKRPQNNAKRRRNELALEPRQPRTTYEFNQAAGNDALSTAELRKQQKAKDAELARTGRAMHEGHRKQWEELRRLNQVARDDLYRQGEERQQEAAGSMKQAFRPQWAALFKQQREQQRRFEQREASVLGTIYNVFTAARSARRPGDTALAVFALLVIALSKAERLQAFEREQERERKRLARIASAAMADERGSIRSETKAKAVQLSQGYLCQAGKLRVTQQQEREALKLAWANRNAERRAVLVVQEERNERLAIIEELGMKARGKGMGLGGG